MGDALDAHDGQRLHAVVVADRVRVPADGLDLVGADLAFEHPFGVRRHLEVDGLAAHHLHRRTAQATGEGRLVDVVGHARRGGEVQRRVADAGDRDLEPLAHLRGLEGVATDVRERRVPPIERREVGLGASGRVAAAGRMRGVEELREAVPAAVAASGLRVLREGHGVGDVRRTLLAEPDMRDLLVQGDVITFDDDLFAGRARLVDDLGRMPARRVGEHLRVVQLGGAPIAEADGHRRALARAEGVEEDRYALGVDGVDLVEHQRRAVLAAHVVHERLQLVGPAPAVERHIHLLQLSVLLEQREELAHVLERHRNPRGAQVAA